MRALFVTVFLLTIAACIAAMMLPFYLLNQTADAVPATTREAGDAATKVIDAFGRLLKTEAWTNVTLHELSGTEGKLDLVLVEDKGALEAERTERWLYVSDLVIEAQVGFTFNYFVSLNPEKWHLEALQTKNGRVKLRAVLPPLEITPEKISSQIRKVTTKDNSTFISKDRVVSQLLSVLMEEHLLPLAKRKANSPGVREPARVAAKQFVRGWILKQYPESSQLAQLEDEDIQIVFADEPAAKLTQEP